MSQSSSNPNWQQDRGLPPVCEVDGCQKDVAYKRMCHMHNKRVKRHGTVDPEAGRPTYRMPVAELIRLRHMVGVPVKGPTKAMAKRWVKQEAS